MAIQWYCLVVKFCSSGRICLLYDSGMLSSMSDDVHVEYGKCIVVTTEEKNGF